MPGRREIIKEDDPTITVGGEPLENHLEQEEKNAVDESRKEEIGTKSKHKKKIRPRERFKDLPSSVAKRVRRMSDWEIRKEYGIMAKPLKTLTQNVLYVLFNAGDSMMNSRDIAEATERKLPDVSSVLSGIWKKLKDTEPPFIHREKVGMGFQYKLTDPALELGLDSVIKRYFPGPGGQRKVERKKVEPIPDQPDPAQHTLVSAADLKPLLERITALEQDGLAEEVKRVKLGLTENNILLESVTRSIEEMLPMSEMRNEFTINVRFLFGRA